MIFPNYQSNMFKLEKLENTDRLRQETFNLNNILIFIIPDFFHNRYIFIRIESYQDEECPFFA